MHLWIYKFTLNFRLTVESFQWPSMKRRLIRKCPIYNDTIKILVWSFLFWKKWTAHFRLMRNKWEIVRTFRVGKMTLYSIYLIKYFFFRLKFHRYHWNSFLTLPSLQKKGSLKIRFTVPSSKYWGFLQLSGVFNVFKTMVWIPPPESWSGPSFTRNIREHPQNF